jgi:transcriptional regulator with XRE-family HTH domain
VKDFGARVRFLREQAGMSRQDLADILGVHKTAVTHWELGDHGTARDPEAVAAAFDMTLVEFLSVKVPKTRRAS